MPTKLFAEFFNRDPKKAAPTITAIRSGLGQAHVGARWSQNLLFRDVVDLDATFRFRGGTRTLRIIRVTVEQDLRKGHRQLVNVWLVTNLSTAMFGAEQIATLYRMRWAIEILFRALKTVGARRSRRVFERFEVALWREREN